jgi:hypothetical protein
MAVFLEKAFYPSTKRTKTTKYTICCLECQKEMLEINENVEWRLNIADEIDTIEYEFKKEGALHKEVQHDVAKYYSNESITIFF